MQVASTPEAPPTQQVTQPVTQGSDSKADTPQAAQSGLVLRMLRGAGIALGLGLIFSWFGVYNTSAFPFAERVLYWTGLMVLGIVTGAVVSPLVAERWLPRAHVAVHVVISSLLISIPITLGLIAMEAASSGTLAPGWWIAMQYFYVLVVSLLLTSLAWVLERYAEKQIAPSSPAIVRQAAPNFVDRLPPKFRAAEIHAVSAEDHYLRVHTSVGETMILMRLADAIRELSALEGLQTHRSWWVAKQGVAETVRTDGKVSLRLKSGAEAPVSRTYAKAVKDAGW